MSLTPERIRLRFAREATRPPERMDLGRAALLVAAEEDPTLDIPRYLARLDELAEDVRGMVGDGAPPILLFRAMVSVFFESGRFRGNVERYHDPRNSYLSEVLDRGVGIPVSLAILLLEVGRRLGLPLEAINFPGHMLVRYRGEAIRLLVDPFRGGEILFEDQAQELLDRLYGPTIPVRKAFLKGVDSRGILIRLLSSLRTVHFGSGDDRRALAAVERLILLVPDAPVHHRDRGILLLRLGRPLEAVTELERYLEWAPTAPDRKRIGRTVARIRLDLGEAGDGGRERTDGGMEPDERSAAEEGGAETDGTGTREGLE